MPPSDTNQPLQPNPLEANAAALMAFSPEPPSGMSKGRKALLALAVVVIVGIGVGLGYFFLVHRSQPGSSSSLYYNRPGYNRADLSTGTGDPEAIITQAVTAPITYNAKPVLQACNLLTIDDLHAAGYHLGASPIPGAVARTYFDGKGTGPLEINSSAVKVIGVNGTNECAYGTSNKTGVTAITIDAFSTGYYPAATIQASIDSNFQKQSPINGVEAYLSTDLASDAKTYLLRYNSTTATVTIALDGSSPGTDQTKVAQTLLGTIAKNMISQTNNPTGPAQLTYSSPAFPKSWADACSLTDASDFKTLLGIDSSPLVEQRLAASTGVINFKDSGGPDTNYAYLASECTRLPANSGHYLTFGFSINTESYTSDTPAKEKFASDRKTDAHQTPITAIVGDETAIYGDQPDLHNALAFRKGRFIVDISPVLPGFNPSATPQQVIQLLTPLAQKIAAKLPQN